MAKGRVRINEIENKEKRDLRKPKVGSFERTIYTHCLHNHDWLLPSLFYRGALGKESPNNFPHTKS